MHLLHSEHLSEVGSKMRGQGAIGQKSLSSWQWSSCLLQMNVYCA